MTRGERVLAAAREAVGVRFRLHGRDVASGLDCVGLAAIALRAGGVEGAIPTGYALRSADPARIAAAAEAAGLSPAPDSRKGDLLLVRVSPAQLHLAIATECGLIHADAMLRRVVERPDIPWPVIGRWRVQGD